MSTIGDAIKSAINTRIAACDAAGNGTQRRKWEAELKAFSLPAYADAAEELGLDASHFDTLAIYAAQKVRRMVGAYAGVSQPDPYTATLLANARGTAGKLASKLMTASLSAKAKLEGELKEAMAGMVRRNATDGTASTQASSTRQALMALGAGRQVGKGEFEVDMEHPLIKAVA